MTVEFDQSGKVEQLDTDTVIAFSNDRNGVIYIKTGAKRRIVQYLRTSVIPNNELFPILFAIFVYLLIVEFEEKGVILIDEEYTGKNHLIKETLEKLLKKHFGKKWHGSVMFGQIGKHSAAHKLAWKIHRVKRRTGIRKIKESEVLALFK